MFSFVNGISFATEGMKILFCSIGDCVCLREWMYVCMCAQFKHLRYFLIFVESLPSMDQVTVNVAGFASRVHSFDILVESCMHGVAKNKKEDKKKKKGKRKI